MKTTKRRHGSASATLLLALGCGALWAQADAPDSVAEAESALAAGNYGRAVELLRSALEQDPGLVEARFRLAVLLTQQGQFDEAGRHFGAVVEAVPEHRTARYAEISTLIMLERYDRARSRTEAGLVALPRDGQLAHILARLLACAPREDVRDGKLALDLALKVHEIKQIPDTTETLAMAYAESGDFDRAIGLQQQVLAEVEGGDAEQTQLPVMRQRLDSYVAGTPWRSRSPIEILMATMGGGPGGG